MPRRSALLNRMGEGKPFGWAIIGPGPIAHTFAAALRGVEGAALVHVQGRSLERAQAFADKWANSASGGPSAQSGTDIDALLRDPAVDAVYIATPHAFHADAIQRCLLADKPVLCEKPMVTDAETAVAMVALSRERHVFLMEALWTRFLPIYQTVGAWLREGAIGEVRSMQSCFAFAAPYTPTTRLFDPAQAGGALLDLGVYNLNVSRWVLQMAGGDRNGSGNGSGEGNANCPPVERVLASAVVCETGVDLRTAATLCFAGGVASQFVAAVDSAGANDFVIAGERGTITLHHPFAAATRATLARTKEAPVVIEQAHRINGFEGEIEEVMRCTRAGQIESKVMSHADTLDTAKWMDQIRAIIGLRYPFDKSSFGA